MEEKEPTAEEMRETVVEALKLLEGLKKKLHIFLKYI